MEKKGVHLKGLNGIRAIAALSVVLSHTFLGLDYFGITKINGGWNFASYGVTMFFTLSGFLITYLLLKEKARFGTVSIKDFYIRRVLRIWPLYYFYILLAAIVLITSFSIKIPNTFYYYLFLGANIPAAMGLSIPLLTHYWSLGVEEQFYLFWPWIVKVYNPLKSVIVFLFVFLAFKIAVRILIPESFLYQLISSTRFDCMAIGALWAILYDENKKRFIDISFNKITQIICWLILFIAAIGKFKIPDIINSDIFSVASAVIILNVAFNEKALIKLENKAFNFIGRISYGIYVYHVLVIYLLGLLLKNRLTFFNDTLQKVSVVSIVVVCTVIVSWLSYEFFEKQFLKYKVKFSKILSRS